MTLIAMAVYDTVENERSAFTERTIESLLKTVNFEKHRLIIVDNNSCKETQEIYDAISRRVERRAANLNQHYNIKVIKLASNVGTANAIFYKNGWVEEMEEVITRMPKVGVLGLKRRDVCESTYALNPDQRSRLLEVPHENGEKWYVIEQCKHVMGTCTMLSPDLIKQVGYFYQMNGLYGFDDSIMCLRAAKAGYINAFMHGVDIEHIDPGGTEYTKWKEHHAHSMIQQYAELERMYANGTVGIYHDIK
jgi:GT2 family glycosyltransferase